MDSIQLHLVTKGDSPPWIIEQKLFDILNEFLQPSATLSAGSAAERLNALYPQNRVEEGEKEEPASFLLEFWDVVIMVAKQLPSQSPAQEKLAMLMVALRGTSTRNINVWSTELRLWADLPLLSASLTEAWNTFDIATLPTESTEKQQQWLNYNAFVARLTRDRTSDASWMAVVILRAALEDEPDSRSTAYQKHGAVLASLVPLAAQWIVLCGPILLTTHDDISKGGRLWSGQDGMSLDRWNFWKQRFHAISEHPMASTEVKMAAKDTEATMLLQEQSLAGDK